MFINVIKIFLLCQSLPNNFKLITSSISLKTGVLSKSLLLASAPHHTYDHLCLLWFFLNVQKHKEANSGSLVDQ